MSKNSYPFIQSLLKTENEQLDQLHAIVQSAFDEEELLTAKIAEADVDQKQTFGERIADRVAQFGGSWTFILAFLGMLIGWIFINSFILLNKAFDPYPYILLNLILSCVAAIQAPVIMMSQNRREAKDRQRAQDDYLINLKSEVEIRNLHRKLDLSIEEQYLHLCEIQQKQLEMLAIIEKKLEKLSKN